MKNLIMMAISVITMTLVACESERQSDLQPSDDIAYSEIVNIGTFSLTSTLKSDEGNDIKTLQFFSDYGSEGLAINIYSCKDGLLGYDPDRDGGIDFYVKPLDSEFTHFAYLDPDKNVIKRFLCTKVNEHEVRVIPINNDVSTPDMRGIFGGKESLKDCFKRRMSSTHGIIMTCASSLIGPEGPLAICASAALSCALWTPN